MIDFAELRRGMVDGQVRTNDVTDLRIIEAMLDIPRERFVPAALKPFAYIDGDVQLRPASGEAPARFMLEPRVLAKLIQLADLQPDELVLDVAPGTGYSSAILAHLTGQVVAVDDVAEFVSAANATLADLDLANVAVVQGSLTAGWPSEAPYDAIFLNGSVEVVPPALLNQLKDGGRLVTVMGHGGAGRAAIFTKIAGGVSEYFDFNAGVPPLPGFSAPPRFVF